MRDDAVNAQAPLLVFLVIGEVALEPFHMAVAFEGQNMRGDAVEEEAIMGDDDRATRKVRQGVFQRAQGVHVEIVGGLIQQQQIGAAFQHLGQMHAVALTAREHAHLLLLVRALEVEGAAIAA